MKIGRLSPMMVLALLVPAAGALAETQATSAARETVVLRQAGVRISAAVPGKLGMNPLQTSATAACSGTACYSVELPQVVRLQGLAFYRTAVDISNNTTNSGVTATMQFAYANAACANGFCRSPRHVITLANLDSFHTDDMVQYLDSQGLLVSGAVNSAVGTLLITFDFLPSSNGWEGTATARIYNRVNEADPSLGTYGYAFPASLFFESAHETLVGTIRDTSPAALAGGTQGSQRTNVGIRNTDINAPAGSNRPINVLITFYDVTQGSATNGMRVGDAFPVLGLVPGEIRIAGNIFSLAHIPSNVSSAIMFIDANPLPPVSDTSTVTIEGFGVTIDNLTQDGSYFELKCGDSNAQITCGR